MHLLKRYMGCKYGEAENKVTKRSRHGNSLLTKCSRIKNYEQRGVMWKDMGLLLHIYIAWLFKIVMCQIWKAWDLEKVILKILSQMILTGECRPPHQGGEQSVLALLVGDLSFLSDSWMWCVSFPIQGINRDAFSFFKERPFITDWM